MRILDVIRTGLEIVALLFLWSSVALAQTQKHEPPQQPSTLKVAVHLVSLRVAVTDQKGQVVPELKKEDFRVYENKIEQSVSFFSKEEPPVSWGLVLDRSGSMMGMMRDVYQAALHVIDEGTEQDEIFVVTFNDQTQIVCGFTTDRHKLENSVLGLRASGQTALYDAVAFALDHIQRGKHQNKVLVVITDGQDNSSRLEFRELIEQVEERDVLIYAVGMFESMDGWRLGLRGGDTRGQLEKLSEVTGAFAYFPTDIEQCRKSMQEIAREVSQQYSLGYYPRNLARDGKWRKIKVEVVHQGEKDQKYVARTRRGYYAPKGNSGGQP